MGTPGQPDSAPAVAPDIEAAGSWLSPTYVLGCRSHPTGRTWMSSLLSLGEDQAKLEFRLWGTAGPSDESSDSLVEDSMLVAPLYFPKW